MATPKVSLGHDLPFPLATENLDRTYKELLDGENMDDVIWNDEFSLSIFNLGTDAQFEGMVGDMFLFCGTYRNDKARERAVNACVQFIFSPFSQRTPQIIFKSLMLLDVRLLHETVGLYHMVFSFLEVLAKRSNYNEDVMRPIANIFRDRLCNTDNIQLKLNYLHRIINDALLPRVCHGSLRRSLNSLEKEQSLESNIKQQIPAAFKVIRKALYAWRESKGFPFKDL